MLAAATMALFASTNATAALINLDTLVGWDIQDQFGAAPLVYNNTYTTSVGVMVRVTDLFVWGDEYRYYIDDVAIGTILVPGAPAGFQPLTQPSPVASSQMRRSCSGPVRF